MLRTWYTGVRRNEPASRLAVINAPVDNSVIVISETNLRNLEVSARDAVLIKNEYHKATPSSSKLILRSVMVPYTIHVGVKLTREDNAFEQDILAYQDDTETERPRQSYTTTLRGISRVVL